MADTSIDNAPGLESCFAADPTEVSTRLDGISGSIPDYVRGVYYLNGPARFDCYGVKYRNWLDGDGMVCRLAFEDDGVHFTNRFVRGRKFIDEQEAGQALYGTFGTRFEGDRMRRGIATESPFNVSAYRFRDRLLAFGEQCIPMELDPVTLETRQEYDFDHQLNGLSPFSAHAKFDDQTGEMFNFGISFAGRQPLANYYRFDSAGKLACRARSRIDHPVSIHDFAVSPDYVVIYLSPYVLDVARMMQAGVSTMESLDWKPELGSTLLVLSRDDGAEVGRFSVGSQYCLHTINAFQRDGRLP